MTIGQRMAEVLWGREGN